MQFLDSHIIFIFESLIISVYIVVYSWTLKDVWSIYIIWNMHTKLLRHRTCPSSLAAEGQAKDLRVSKKVLEAWA